MILTQAIPTLRSAELDVFDSGHFSTNPSILRLGAGYVCVVKGVNFDFERIWLTGDWQALDPEEPIACDYKLVHLDTDFRVLDVFDLDTSDVPQRLGGPASVEDLRLFWRDNVVWACGCAIERESVWTGARWIMGAAQSRVFAAELVLNRLENVHVFVSPARASAEKNWMPVSGAEKLTFVVNIARGGFVAYDAGAANAPTLKSPDADLRWEKGWSGSSCLTPWDDGYLAVIHRRTPSVPSFYRHMFVVLDKNLAPVRSSAPFSFEDAAVEFCCGLDVDADYVCVSYGVMDRKAAIARFARKDIAATLVHPVAAGGLPDIDPELEPGSALLRKRGELLDARNVSLLQELFASALRIRDLERQVADLEDAARLRTREEGS